MRILISTAVLLGVVLAAAAVPWPESSTRLQIRNDSGQSISSMTLIVKSGGKSVTRTLNPLAAGEVQSLAIDLRGEGSYELHVTLADGTRLRGGPGYIESGQGAMELIQRDRVEGKYSGQF